MTPKISVIVPVYNEEKYVMKFLPRIVWGLNQTSFDWQLIISENGSQDETLKLVRGFSKHTKHVQVISSPNPNYGLAVKKGFLAADGQYLVLFDLDYFNVDFVHKALLKMDKFDAVVGSKRDPKSKDTRPLLRRAVTFCFSSILKVFFGLKISDTHGIKVLNRKKFLPLIKKSRMTKEIFDTELLLRGQKEGLSIGESPIQVKERRASRSSIIKRGLRTIKDLAKLKLIFIKEFLRNKTSIKWLEQLWPIIVLSLLTWLLLSPSLRLPFSLIDDGVILEYSHKIREALSTWRLSNLDWLLLETNGRSRPFYWLFMFIQYQLVGTSAYGFHLIRILLVLVVVLLVYQLSSKLSKSKLVSFLSTLPVLLFYRTMENFYRLGPQEVPMLLFLLLAVYLVIKKSQHWLGRSAAPLFIVLAILTKETAIFITPFLLLLLLIDKPKRSTWLRLFISSLIGLAFILITRIFNSASHNYASNFQLEPSVWLATFLEYKRQLDSAWLTRLFQFSLLSFVIAVFKKDRLKVPLLALAWLAVSFAILLPWKMAFGRYLTPVMPALGLFIAYETYRQLKYSLKQPLFLPLLLIFAYYWANFIFTNTIQSLNVATDYIAREQANAQLVKLSAQALPKNTTLYLNFKNDPNFHEWVDGIERHFHYIYKRPDLETKILKENKPNYLATWSFAPPQKSLESLPSSAQIGKIHTQTHHYNPILKNSFTFLLSTPFLVPSYDSSYTWHLHKLN